MRINKDIAVLGKPTIIGIDGAITSGKTTFATDLNLFLRGIGCHTLLIHIDDFHNPRAVRTRDGTPECYLDNAIDIKRLDSLIADIRRGPISRTMVLLNMGTDTYCDVKTFTTQSDTIIIVEGVFLYRSPTTTLFDYKIHLDVTHDEILRRGRLRDVPLYGESIMQQYVDLYIPVQQLYVSRYMPAEQSNLVIDNNDVTRPFIVD